MKYLLLLCDSDWSAYANETPEQTAKTLARIGAWWEDKEKKGVILHGGQLQGPDKATTVRPTGGPPLVVDGPFIESKETVGGYALIEAVDRDAAVVVAKEWLGLLPLSIVEVRPLAHRDR